MNSPYIVVAYAAVRGAPVLLMRVKETRLTWLLLKSVMQSFNVLS